MCGQGLVELNRNTVHVFFFLKIVVFLWIAVFVHLLAGQDSSKVACGGVSRTTPLYQPKWCVSFCSIRYILSLVAVVTYYISRQIKLLPDEKKSNWRSFFAVDRCFCCVGPGFSIITADPPKTEQNSKKFCVCTVFYFYKSSLLYPDLQAVLFRRWSFGVLLWEIETGGEFCCLGTLPPCESSAKDRDWQSWKL